MPENTESKKSLGILPYTTRIDRQGNVRLSSHSALVIDAASYTFFEEGGISKIYIPGENTFGPDFSSTAELMRDALIKKGIPSDLIHIQGNLNNTEEQLRWILEQEVKDPYTAILILTNW